jgi:hypothetical protein
VAGGIDEGVPGIGIAPKLTDAELVTLAVMQALLGFTSEARWMRHAHKHLGHLFHYLPRQPGYNKRLRRAATLITTIIRMLAVDTTLWSDDVWVVDSTPVECGRSKDTTRRSDLAGWARPSSATKPTTEKSSNRPSQKRASNSCDRPAKANRHAPAPTCSSHYARPSNPINQTFKANWTWNATAATPQLASRSASCNASSP